MTHFSVLIIGDNTEDLMAPYDEQLEVPEHVAMTRKEASEKKKEEIKKLKGYVKEDPDGKVYRIDNVKKKIIELEAMPDEDYFKEKVDWYDKFNKNGEPLTTSNPDGKWDYWGPEDFLYAKGVKKKVSTTTAGKADWKRYREEALKEAEKSWKQMVEAHKKNPEMYSETVMNRENFLKDASDFHTYAVVTSDGEWHAPGQCGWFGMSSDSASEWNKWVKEYFDRFIKDLPPDTKITLVDCHV